MNNKHVVITGGHGHLGHAMTECILDAGGFVSIFGRNSDIFFKRFKNYNKNVSWFNVDISKNESIKQGIKDSISNFKTIDVLINNSYYCKFNGNSEKMTDNEWEYGVDGTLNSVYRCIRQALPHMKTGSSIINIASMYGMVSPDFRIYDDHKGYLSPPSYGASKAGVIQLTRYFASYLAEKGIRVNSISPGAFPSEKVQKESPIFVDNLVKRIPMKRIGNPDDLKGVTLLLASDASMYMTGQNIPVDGGWTII